MNLQSRELAYLALLSIRDEKHFLDSYFKNIKDISKKDLKLAKEIAYGTCKRLLSLEKLASKLGKIKLKKKEKILLYTAIYQFFFYGENTKLCDCR